VSTKDAAARCELLGQRRTFQFRQLLEKIALHVEFHIPVVRFGIDIISKPHFSIRPELNVAINLPVKRANYVVRFIKSCTNPYKIVLIFSLFGFYGLALGSSGFSPYKFRAVALRRGITRQFQLTTRERLTENRLDTISFV